MGMNMVYFIGLSGNFVAALTKTIVSTVQFAFGWSQKHASSIVVVRYILYTFRLQQSLLGGVVMCKNLTANPNI